MGLLDLFRRAPPIRDPHELAQFIDERAAFVVQKGIYEYSRARAAHYAKVLFADPVFLQAAEVSRWRAYPLGLAMVAEVVEGVLRPHAGRDVEGQAVALRSLVLGAFDRYPTPTVLDGREWRDARTELQRRLRIIGTYPVKRVIDIPETIAESYFALMPIHEQLRGRDFPTMHSYLKIVLCNVHDDLTKRMDAPALVQSLRLDPELNEGSEN
jgi:hypothetical protein